MMGAKLDTRLLDYSLFHVQGKPEMGTHPLHGAVARRIRLFDGHAEHAPKTERPAREEDAYVLADDV